MTCDHYSDRAATGPCVFDGHPATSPYAPFRKARTRGHACSSLQRPSVAEEGSMCCATAMSTREVEARRSALATAQAFRHRRFAATGLLLSPVRHNVCPHFHRYRARARGETNRVASSTSGHLANRCDPGDRHNRSGLRVDFAGERGPEGRRSLPRRWLPFRRNRWPLRCRTDLAAFRGRFDRRSATDSDRTSRRHHRRRPHSH